MEGGGAAKVKVEATPPPYHRTLLHSSVAYFANMMTDVPSTLHSLANVFSIRQTRNTGQRTQR